MTIVQRMRDELKDAMRARDAVRLNVLRYWIAQLTLGDGSEVGDADAVKRMRGVIKEAKTGQTSFSPEEMAILQEWVPPTLTVDQIDDALEPVRDQIRAAPREGMAMGLAMKALAGKAVESDDVRAIVAQIRGGS